MVVGWSRVAVIITNYGKILLQITAALLQITTMGYYKLWQLLVLLQMTRRNYYKLGHLQLYEKRDSGAGVFL